MKDKLTLIEKSLVVEVEQGKGLVLSCFRAGRGLAQDLSLDQPPFPSLALAIRHLGVEELLGLGLEDKIEGGLRCPSELGEASFFRDSS